MEMESCFEDMEEFNDCLVDSLCPADSEYDDQLNACVRYMELWRKTLKIHSKLVGIEKQGKTQEKLNKTLWSHPHLKIK